MSVYLCVTRMDQLTTRCRPADAKVSARQQCVYEDPQRKWCAMLHAMVGLYHGLPCLHHGIAWHTIFAGDLHTRTAVARLPLHQLVYILLLTDPSV